MRLPVMCGSPFVRSKRTGFHCRSRRPELLLPHTAGRVGAPGHRRAGWRGRQQGNCISTHQSAFTLHQTLTVTRSTSPS